MWKGSDASWGTLLSQGLCEIKGRHICQVQLKQLANILSCGDKSSCVIIYHKMLLASDLHLPNHSTSHLASSTPPLWKSIQVFLESPGGPVVAHNSCASFTWEAGHLDDGICLSAFQGRHLWLCHFCSRSPWSRCFLPVHRPCQADPQLP